MKHKLMRLVGQSLAYLAFIGTLGYLSANPAYQHVDPGATVVKLIFSHASTRVSECRTLTQEEMDALAPNMRRPMECPRGRNPVYVEIVMDGDLLYRGTSDPIGLWGDGPAIVYEKFVVAPGQHQVEVRLRDTARLDGFDYTDASTIDLSPRQNYVIGFRPETGFRFSEG
ncbi:MAG: hypothetical protein ACR2QQ_11150 [Gammaproteobacteria bacterium]